MAKRKRINKTIAFEPELYHKLAEAAARQNRDLAKHIRHVLQISVGMQPTLDEEVFKDMLRRVLKNWPQAG